MRLLQIRTPLQISPVTLLLSLTFALVCQTSFGKNLQCQMKINDIVVSSMTIDSKFNQKTKIAQAQGITAYITEKEANRFVAETFIPQYDMRVYAQGNIRATTDQLSSSIWTRDILIDVDCLPSEKN